MNIIDPDEQPPGEPEFSHALLPPGFLKNPVHLLAFGFGSGAAARAPGTWGSLAAIPIWLLFFWVPPYVYLAIIVVTFLVGIWLCGTTARNLKVHDHGGIVWDEFVGMWVALALIPNTIVGVLMVFLLFRFFDVLKPWPISWFDQRVPGGVGIMVDDLLAGLMALLCFWLIQLYILPGFV